MSLIESLLDLAHGLGDPAHDLCICAEGNVSGAADDGTFWVKASGVPLRGIGAEGFVQMRVEDVAQGLEAALEGEEQVREFLNSKCLTRGGPVPSTEAFLHASLLQGTDARYVAHSHPTPLLSLLCTADAEYYARQRLFPDEIVLCGPAACHVPYFAPGLPLARQIRERTARYRNKWGGWPKTIWLQNHGLICLGQTASEALAASLMSVKAARVLLGALSQKSEPTFLTAKEIEQIHRWPDEQYRQRQLYGS